MPDTKLHRFLRGGWNAMSASDTRIYYDGAWHDPCAGAKTLWHYKDGTWHKFPCGGNLVYFSGTPDDFGFNSGLQAFDSGGTALTTSGDKLTRFTLSSYADNGSRDFDVPIPNRDYTKLYTTRTLAERLQFLYIEGDNAPNYVEWDLTNGGLHTAPDAPIWVEVEFANDGGFRWLMWGASAEQEFSPIIQATYNTFVTNSLMLHDPTVTGSDPTEWYDDYIGEAHTGDIDDVQWHTVRWKIPSNGQAGQIVVDGNVSNLSAISGVGTKVKAVRVGICYNNYWGGGWMYIGRVKIGTAPGLGDIVTYTPHKDGYPWQNPRESGTPVVFPNMSESPDRTVSKNYAINMSYAGSAPDDIDWSYPSFSTDNFLPPSGGQSRLEIWEIDQTGLVDVTLSDYAGPDHLILGQDAGYPQNYPSYPVGYPNKWISLWAQVTDYGLDALVTHLDDVESNYPLNIFSASPTSLYRYELDGSGFPTLTKTLLKDGSDYPQIQNGGPRYSDFGARFTPSGDQVYWFKSISEYVPNFPSTSLLDNFNRADAPNLGSNWTDLNAQMIIGLTSGGGGSHNTVFMEEPGGGPTYASAYYNAIGTLTDCEAFIDIYPRFAAGGSGRVGARLQPGTYTGTDMGDGYWFAGNELNNGTAYLVKSVSGTETVLGSINLISYNSNTPSKIGIRCKGNLIQAFAYHNFGFWQLVIQVTDNTFSSGYIGMGNGNLDNFSGGALTFRPASGTIEFISRDATGYFTVDFPPGQASIQWLAFNPDDETEFFFTGPNSTGTNYHGLWKGTTAGVYTLIVEFPDSVSGYPIISIPKISPDKTRIAFISIDYATPGRQTIKSCALDGTDLVDHLLASSYNAGDFSWSRDGSEIIFALTDTDNIAAFSAVKISDDSIRDIITVSDGLPSYDVNNLVAFHGHQGE